VSGNGGGADDDWSLEWSGPAVTIWSRPIENRSYRQYKGSFLLQLFHLGYNMRVPANYLNCSGLSL